MSTTVKTVTDRSDRLGTVRFYVIESMQDSYSCVMGRRFWVRTTLEHYMHPGAPEKDFTDRIVTVFQEPGYKCLRFSRTTVRPGR